MLNIYSQVFIFTIWKQSTAPNVKTKILTKVALLKAVNAFCVRIAITFFQ